MTKLSWLTLFSYYRADANVYMLDYLLNQPVEKPNDRSDSTALAKKAFGLGAEDLAMLDRGEDERSNGLEGQWIGFE